MPIRVTCLCGKVFDTDDAHAGRRVHCPGCDVLVYVPQPPLLVIGEVRPRPRGWPSAVALVAIAVGVGLIVLLVAGGVDIGFR